MDQTPDIAATPLPPKIAEAICAVMSKIEKLNKGEENKHANYMFASIDDFLELIRPKIADAGLVIVQDEDEFEVVGDGERQWLKLRYRFTLAHKSGETWAHRPTRTIMVQAKMGSQAFGAAQSYVEKQFLRSLFKIATGEKDQDADSHPQDNLPASRGRSSGARTAAPKPQEDAATVKAREDADRIKEAINLSKTPAEIDTILKVQAKTLESIKAVSQTAYEFLIKFANERQQACQKQAA